VSRSALAATLAVALLGAPADARSTPAEGDRVVITGVVADRAGTPIAGLEVTLEASRTSFDVRAMRREKAEIRRVSAQTNARGEFSIEWPWTPGFDLFELVAGVGLRGSTGERFSEFARGDVSRRVRQGGQVIAALEVQDTALLEALRGFLAELTSDDERRIYEEMGRPDSIDRVNGSGWTEATWWYFATGRACRFRDGRLVQVQEFDPVRAF
jgi:hypothetical protein